MTDTATATGTDDDGFSGILSAFRYAFARTDSRLFRSYVVLSALFGAFVSVLLLATLGTWFVTTVGESALTTTSNAFLGVIALFILMPLFAPVVFVARGHRRSAADQGRRDLVLAVAGYLFMLSVYLALVISVPPEYQSGGGALVGFLYSLPQLSGLVLPVLATVAILLANRATR